MARLQAENYERLSKELHDYHLLQDSNALMRTEKEAIVQKLSTAEKQVLCGAGILFSTSFIHL